MSKPVPKLALKTVNGEWSLSLYKALWLCYGVPAATIVLSYEYGILGFVIGVILLMVSPKRINK